MANIHSLFNSIFSKTPPHTPALDSPTKLARKMGQEIDTLEQHLAQLSYGEFHLTRAIRPSVDLKVKPVQGFRHDCYRDDETDSEIPVVMASVSANCLFPLFADLARQLGDSVDVVLESSHDPQHQGHRDYYREQIDMPVLLSTLWDFEDLLLNDGCTGIAILNPSIPQEIQFDEHKLLIVYGTPLEPFEQTLNHNGVHLNPRMRFITEAEHIHSTTHGYQQQFDELRMRLGIDDNPPAPDAEPPEAIT